MRFLKNHPFAVEAFFKCSTVLTFAVPKDQLQDLIPQCLSLDLFKEKWGFIAIALVETKDLRPKGIPSFLGNDFFLIGYRIFVRFVTENGKKLRGLYILKSETNKRKMQFFGNIFTHYKYTTTDINIKRLDSHKIISSKRSNFELDIDTSGAKVELPSSSPFDEWKEARQFAGPLPFTFTYNQADSSVLIIQGVRSNWTPNPINVNKYKFEFLNTLNLEGVVLANAFEIKNIPYYWKKGQEEKWM